MFGRSGLTLIETLVAALVGVVLAVAIGLLGGSLVRQRVRADTVSAATSLAEKELETLRNVPDPLYDLAAGTSPWRTVDEAGNASLAGPFQIQTEIQDNQPPLPETLSKRLTARVRLAGRSAVIAELTTYLVVAQPALGSTPAPTPTPVFTIPVPTLTPPPLEPFGDSR